MSPRLFLTHYFSLGGAPLRTFQRRSESRTVYPPVVCILFLNNDGKYFPSIVIILVFWINIHSEISKISFRGDGSTMGSNGMRLYTYVY